MQSEFALTPHMSLKYKICIEACSFISLDVAIYVMLYNIQNAWCSLCLFCEYWFEIINYNMHYIYMCYKWIACESKIASIFILIVGSLVGRPLLPYLKVVGCPLSCPLSCPLYPYMEAVGNPFCMANSHGQLMCSPPHCPSSRQLLSYMEVVGSLICMLKSHWQPKNWSKVKVNLEFWNNTFCLLIHV